MHIALYTFFSRHSGINLYSMLGGSTARSIEKSPAKYNFSFLESLVIFLKTFVELFSDQEMYFACGQ